MIAPLASWTWELQKGGVLLRPREDPECAEIWYRERVRPLAHVSALVAGAPRLVGFREDERTPIEAFLTDEGEYAAQVTLRGRLDGVAAARTFAFVLGDDYVARVIGLARRAPDIPVVVETTRTLARTDVHLLGVRRRRYVYRPPGEGWHGYLLPPFHAHFIPLGYPRDPTLISVLPAIPGTANDVLDTLVDEIAGDGEVEAPAPTAIAATGGLWGNWCSFVAGEVTTDTVVFGDDRYAYAMTMTSSVRRRDEHLETFMAMARSIEPIPRPVGTRITLGPTSLSHWTE